jgi:hypothetical protein
MSNIANNPLQALLQQTGQVTSYFASTSRYYTVDTGTYQPPGGGPPINYVRRRFCPDASAFSLLRIHTVTEGERLDNITNLYFGDPLQFWQICDANNAVDPDELTDTIGGAINITLPLGVPGVPSNA